MSADVTELTIASKRVYVHCGDSSDCAFVMGHGASGDAHSGNLPMIAQQVAKLGVTVVRYNASGQLKSRISMLEATLL